MGPTRPRIRLDFLHLLRPPPAPPLLTHPPPTLPPNPPRKSPIFPQSHLLQFHLPATATAAESRPLTIRAFPKIRISRPCVGEFLIENVELKFDDGVTEFRRRLRFKRMPNFVQSQIRIRPKKDSILDNLDDLEFELEKGVLVQPYLSPMVAGIAVIHRFLDEQSLPRALCLGVGGGALLGFLADHLNFEVDGVEEDEVVLEAARRHFGLNNEFIHLFVEDGIRYLKRIANKYDIVMVDLDSRDVMSAVSAPPVEFVEGSVLRAAREVLRDKGVLVANVIPSSKMFFERLVCGVEEIFEEVYEIDVGNEEDFVLIAAKSGVGEGWDGDGSAFLNKLKLVVSCSYIDSIRRISKIR
ncbi:hypothetical protein SASPL_104574 [Salvia splendens]|uniref:Spermidine synthase n=1 Tax=Salvia splendens TaxID=180675 RepID=A0A8X9AAT0_SALSN|nr:hypothetical protein SASPL_104574 [Salvia splendens]